MESIRSGRVIASRYRLEAPLAQGGMGSVWKARHLQLDTLLAVKFINLDQRATAGGRARFEREAKAAALLHGPNVVEVYDYGVDAGLPYLAMELLDGEDLSRRLAREGRLPIPALVNLIDQVSRALRRAHEEGIVHRDLKPGNIFLVEREDEEPLVKVLDFGIARTPRLGSVGEVTKTGTLLGSPRYMSPEQARAPRSVDPRSDLWSVAVIAFRALTGRLPFVADEIGELLVKICTEPAPSPSSIRADLGTDFDRFFERALARNPRERFQTARELAMELAICAGMPPPSSQLTVQTTAAWAAERALPVSSVDRGVTDLVAIATIVHEGAACEDVVEAKAVLSSDSLATVREGRLRTPSTRTLPDAGTLTGAPRSFDVAYRLPALRSSRLLMGASAVLVGLAGLAVGAFVAMNVLSSPPLPAAPVSAPAPPPLASVTPLEIAAPAPSAPFAPPAPAPIPTARWPRPASSSAAPPAGPRVRPSIRRTFTLGI